MRRFFGWDFRTGLLIGCLVALGVAAAAVTYERYDTKTLKRTVRRDAVHCGVNTGLPGFSAQDGKGNWSGFDVDFCRAIAAAIFDDPKKVKFVPLDAKERFDELGKRKIDVLARNSTWTMSRETEYYLHFAGVSYYDGQGFMVPRARNIDTALGARRQQGLRADRNHHRAQSRRLLPRQQHEVRGEEVRHARRSVQGLSRRPVRRADGRRVAALRAAAEVSPSPASTSSWPTSFPRSRCRRWCARRTTTGCSS